MSNPSPEVPEGFSDRLLVDVVRSMERFDEHTNSWGCIGNKGKNEGAIDNALETSERFTEKLREAKRISDEKSEGGKKGAAIAQANRQTA